MTLPASLGGGVSGAVVAPPPATITESYVLFPLPLALDVRNSELAAAIYLIIARAFLVQQAPVPLSASDIQAIDASSDLSRGAILRALDRLLDQGWLITQARRGHKATYIPSWGLIAGEPRPWVLGKPALDRPRFVQTARVPRIVLDVCIGRLMPHRQHAVCCQRYVTRPPLSLRDIGAYALTWAEVGEPTQALRRLGLVGPTGPLPPPSEETLLARISQLPLFDPEPEPPALSQRGLRRVGLLPDSSCSGPEPQLLFFVPPDMIGSMIPPVIEESISGMIGPSEQERSGATASVSSETPRPPAPMTATGTQGNLATQGKQGTPTPTSGGSSSGILPAATTSDPTPDGTTSDMDKPIPPAVMQSSVEELLRARGLFPDVARRYAGMPRELVEQAYEIAHHLRWAKEPLGAMVWLLNQERAAPGWMEERWKHLLPSLGVVRNEEACEVSFDSSDERAPLYRLLRSSLDSQIRPFIELHQLTLAAGTVSIVLPDWFSADERMQVAQALQEAAAQLGLVAILPPVSSPPIQPESEPVCPSQPRQHASHAVVEPPPDWIDPAIWDTLRMVDQAALLGSRWEGGAIVGKGPQVTKLLRTRLADLVARLRPTP